MLFLPLAEIGQNISTAMKQVACAELGIDGAQLRVRLPSTSEIGPLHATVGSLSVRDFAIPLAQEFQQGFHRPLSSHRIRSSLREGKLEQCHHALAGADHRSFGALSHQRQPNLATRDPGSPECRRETRAIAIELAQRRPRRFPFALAVARWGGWRPGTSRRTVAGRNA